MSSSIHGIGGNRHKPLPWPSRKKAVQLIRQTKCHWVTLLHQLIPTIISHALFPLFTRAASVCLQQKPFLLPNADTRIQKPPEWKTQFKVFYNYIKVVWMPLNSFKKLGNLISYSAQRKQQPRNRLFSSVRHRALYRLYFISCIMLSKMPFIKSFWLLAGTPFGGLRNRDEHSSIRPLNA